MLDLDSCGDKTEDSAETDDEDWRDGDPKGERLQMPLPPIESGLGPESRDYLRSQRPVVGHIALGL